MILTFCAHDIKVTRLREPAADALSTWWNFPGKHLPTNNTVILILHCHHAVTGQNGSGQNGTDKMVWTKWYTDKMVLDKMVWTKWYNFIFCVHFNSVEFNI